MAPFAERWPRWPADAAGKEVMAVQVQCSVDTLFEMAFLGESDFTKKCAEIKQDKDTASTDWLSSEAEADEAVLKPGTHAHTTLKGNALEGKLRKHGCSSFSMGMKYNIEEIERVLVAQEGKQYVLEACVATTATYGDRMRSIVKTKLEAVGPKSCTWTSEFTIVFVAATNGFIKKAINSGATGGITKSFESSREVLSKFHQVSAKGAQPAATAEEPAAAAAPQAQVETAAPAAPRSWHDLWLRSEYLHAWQPLCSWMVDKANGAGIPMPAWATQDLATLLSLLLLCLAISTLLHLLHWTLLLLQSLPGMPSALPPEELFNEAWSPAYALASLLRWMDFPTSVRAVLIGAALLAAAHELLARAAVYAVPKSVLKQGQQISRKQSLIREDSDAPKAGVMYAGFNQALESATANITDAATELASPKPSQTPVTSPGKGSAHEKHSSLTKENLKTGFKNMYKDMKEAWSKATTNLAEPEFPAPADGSTHSGKAADIARNSSFGLSRAGSGSPSKPLNSGTRSSAPSRIQSETGPEPSAEVLANLQPSGGDEAAAAAAKSPPATSSGTRSPSRLQKSGPSNASQLAAAFNKSSMMASLGFGSRSSLNREAAGAAPESAGVSKGAADDIANRTDSAALDDVDEQVPRLEEMYEHERYSPFTLAWGHRYPGYFLPTDKVGHWGVLNGKDAGKDLSKFDEVAPKLPKGWKWLEDEWLVDMGGLGQACIDNEGWSYAVDFPWLHQPPNPGAGRFKRVRDYVRRRRWIRTRVLDMSQQQPPHSASAPVSSTEPQALDQQRESTRDDSSAPSPRPAGSPVSPGRRVRIADIAPPDDGSRHSLLTQALAAHDPANGQSAEDASAMAVQPSARSESHALASPSDSLADGLLSHPSRGVMGAARAGPRTISCPEDIQDPDDKDPDPAARAEQYNPHLSLLPLLESTSPTLQVQGSAFDDVSEYELRRQSHPQPSDLQHPDPAAGKNSMAPASSSAQGGTGTASGLTPTSNGQHMQAAELPSPSPQAGREADPLAAPQPPEMAVHPHDANVPRPQSAASSASQDAGHLPSRSSRDGIVWPTIPSWQ
ncbi:hypothetical protein WJX73_009310 [Symbiochloris irregularis]|uniref:VASt domain-containing protein n=1 Tax=Symbiochloris irregularis TaxID=706552 RepID=A0AAW1NYD8_9CHLO